PVGGGRAALRAALDAQRDGRDRGREDVEKRGEHLSALGGPRPLWAGGGRALSDLRALPPAPRFWTRRDGSGGRQSRALAELLPRASRRRAGVGLTGPTCW